MQPDILQYSKLKERILKVPFLTAQQILLSLPAQLEQQHDVSPSQVWHKINSLVTIPDGNKINYARKLWRRCLPVAVRANTTSSMVNPTEDQLDNADQHAAMLTAKPTTSVFSFPSLGPMHHQQSADNHHKQPSQLTKLKEGVYGYHRMYEDRAFKCAKHIQAKKPVVRSPRLGLATADAPHTGLYATDEKTPTKVLVDTVALYRSL